ncbi:MAG: cob(I)yrinic acid a,c-diamide adenosyltransferase [Candidatus Kerfeldbacteria bacterium]|nr:cob(I)yrinic acid a,c-diamide adenosyltransferase [Candidatus Kerfeldbacteria bacterium]
MKRSAVKQFRAIDRGLTIAYVGDGKGKTTAAVGLATRAAGYGWPVLFFQFYKSAQWPSGERVTLKKLGVDVRVRGKGFVGILGDRKSRRQHRQAAASALAEAKQLLFSGKYKLVILDEIIACSEQKLFPVSAIAKLLNERAKHPKAKLVHVAMTGHSAYPAVLKRCDLVTEMKMVKHPYYQGIIASKGIDY